MRRLLLCMAVFCIMCLLAGCGVDREQMLRQLELLEQANVNREPMENDSLAEALVAYFDRHGSANERMRAKYILGRTYYCLGELPRALETYYEAADCADTTASDCDFAKLSRIHAQSAVIFDLQVQPRSQLKELRLAEYYARRGRDTMMAIECYAQQADAYHSLHYYDSVIYIREKASQLFRENGQEGRAAQTLGSSISSLLQKKMYSKAIDYAIRYETRSNLFNEDGDIEQGREIYYFIKGQLFIAVNKLDSAEYMFRKELRDGKDLNNQIAGCKGLQEVYERKKVSDSIAKYAKLGYELNDSAYSLSEMQNVQKMQAAYNYSHNKQIVEEKTLKAERLKSIVIIIFALLLILSWFASDRFGKYKKKLAEYRKNLQILESLQSELQELCSEESLASIDIFERKQKAISEVFERILQYKRRTKPSRDTLEIRLAKAPIVLHLKKLANANPYIKASNEDFRQMRELINVEIPLFYSSLNTPKYTLSVMEYNVSILIRLHFVPSEIYKLTGASPGYISNLRRRLLEKVYGIEGTPKDYDERILSIN